MKNVNVKNKKIHVGRVSVKRILIWIAALVLTAALFLGILVSVNAYRNSGMGIRNTVVLKSEHFTVTLPMYTYYFRSMEAGADLDLVAMALTDQLALYEAALKDNESLSEQRSKLIDAEISSLEQTAKEKGMSVDKYLALQYGRGIKIQDIRDILGMTALAAQKQESLWAEVSVDENAMSLYCMDHADDFKYIDYLSYVFTVPLTASMTSAEKEQLIAQYEAYANRLANDSADAEAFVKNAIGFEETFLKEQDKDAVYSEEEKADLRREMTFERSAYSLLTDSDAIVKDLNTWLYSSDRKTGESRVLPYRNSEKNVATFGVYYITRPLYTNDDPTHTYYDVQLSYSKYTQSAAASNVQKAKDMYLKDPTEKTIASLAETYGGGLFENVAHVSTLSEELYAWLGEERKQGDVLVYEDSDGWHLVCYQKQGLPENFAQAKLILEEEAYEAMMEEYRNAHAVTVNRESYYTLPARKYGWLIF